MARCAGLAKRVVRAFDIPVRVTCHSYSTGVPMLELSRFEIVKLPHLKRNTARFFSQRQQHEHHHHQHRGQDNWTKHLTSGSFAVLLAAGASATTRMEASLEAQSMVVPLVMQENKAAELTHMEKMKNLASKLMMLLKDAMKRVHVLLARNFDKLKDHLLNHVAKHTKELVASAANAATTLIGRIHDLLSQTFSQPHLLAKPEASAANLPKESAPLKSNNNKSSATAASAAGNTPKTVAVVQQAAGKPETAAPVELAVAEQQNFYQQYGYLIIGGSILGALLGVILSRRALDSESSRLVALRAAEAVKSTAPAHPRRASVGGPLQNSTEHAALVREALEILSASPALLSVLGKPPYREGRLQTLNPKGQASSLMGNLPIKHENGQCSVFIQGVLSEAGVECQSLVVNLPNGKKIDVPIVSN